MIYKPHPYQQYAINRVIRDPAAGLFLRPGLGKTVITLTAIEELIYGRWEVGKVLVIAPKTVADLTWTTEAAKWEHLRHLRVIRVAGTPTQRIKALATPGDIYVLGRDSTTWLVDYYRQRWPFDMLVVDESTSFKNARSGRFRALKLVRRFCRRVVLLTGTPASRSLSDMWAQMYLLDEGARLGRTITQFRDIYMLPDKRNATQIWSYKPKDGAETAVLDAVKDVCISMTAEDYLQLPACVEHVIPVQLDSKSRKAYDAFEREQVLQLPDEEEISAGTAAVLTGKLLQYCGGAVYNEDGAAVTVNDCKLQAYADLLEAIGDEHALTFYGYQHERDRLCALLAKLGKRYRVYSSPEDAAAWNAGAVDVLLAHPASCAYGLNLQQGGQHVIWYGLNWSYELNDQGRCRLWRQGSDYDKVCVHYLVVQDGVDVDVMEAIRTRSEMHTSIMSALKARIEKYGRSKTVCKN